MVVNALEIALSSLCEKSVLKHLYIAVAVRLKKSLCIVKVDNALDILQCQLIISYAIQM